MTTKKNFVFAFISLFAMLLTALGISFAFPSQKADSAIDWTGHSYTKFTPYSTTDGVYLSPIEDNARLGFVVVVVGGYSLIGGSYNGFMTTSGGATCGIDGTTYKGAQHQGTNTNYYDIRYRIEAYAQSNVYIRQARVAAKNASGFYALYTDTDYGINSTTTSFKYGQTIDRDDTFGTVEGSGAYDINMLYDLVLVYEYFINGNSVRVSAGSVADELAGGLGAATTVNPADYEREGYALEGFWTGENKTGTQVLDADGYFVNDYAYTPGATLYPGYTNIIYWTDETAWSSAGQDFNNYSWQGSGTEEDPYLIRSEWDLAYLSWTIYNADEYGVTSSDLYYYDGKYFLQTKDLNFEGYYWQPIGIAYTREGIQVSRYFSGSYNGGSCTISGIKNTPEIQGSMTVEEQYALGSQGLFGRVYGTRQNNVTIKNLGVIDSYIQGYQNIGGIVGFCDYSTIKNCYFSGVVLGEDDCVGGIAGSGDNIINCYNTGSVKGHQDVGGVVGYASGDIRNVYNTGSVSGRGNYVGGIIGRMYRYSSLRNSYNTGAVTGANYFGGVVGSAGFAIVYETYFGGDCNAAKGIGEGYGTATRITDPVEEWAKNKAWYLDPSNWNSEYPWDFENVWAIYGEMVNEGYPVFIRYWTDIYYTFDNYVFSGAGTQADPYLIETPQQLAYLSWTIYSGSAHNGQSITINGENYYYQNSCFRQTANIDLSAGYWQPIGIFSTRESSEIVNRYFAGNYDGNGYIITGINIPEDTEYSYQGLFGVVKGNITDASVTNVAIYNSNIHGLEYVGGIAGYVGANASVTNSFYQGGVYGSSSGGIVGQVEGGEVSSSGFEGDVSAGVSAIAGVISNGGLVDSSYGIAESPAQSGIAMYGQIDGGTIQNSLSICHDGDVTSKNYIGSDFSEFVWLNTDSSPIPRSLTWIGSIWPGSVTVDMLSSSGWTEIVA